MVCIVPYPRHERSRLLGKDDSCDRTLVIYIELFYALSRWIKCSIYCRGRERVYQWTAKIASRETASTSLKHYSLNIAFSTDFRLHKNV